MSGKPASHRRGGATAFYGTRLSRLIELGTGILYGDRATAESLAYEMLANFLKPGAKDPDKWLDNAMVHACHLYLARQAETATLDTDAGTTAMTAVEQHERKLIGRAIAQAQSEGMW